MQKRVLMLTLAAASVAAIAVACGGSSSTTSTPSGGSQTTSQATTAPYVAGPNDVVAVKKSPAALKADDPAWSSAKATTITTTVIPGSATKAGNTVQMQALYSDSDVWFKYTWADSTQSLFANWTFDGTKWTNDSGQQDRLGMMWQIAPITDFATKGCFAVCHNPSTDPFNQWYMISPKGQTADLWQWTAKSSNAMNQMGDYTLIDTLNPPTSLGSTFVTDPYTGGGSFTNKNAAGTAPEFMQSTTVAKPTRTDAIVLQEAVLLDPTKFKAGDKVPNTIVAPYQGDRGDVDAVGTWSNNQWTVVAHRKLDTGNTDDVKFTVGGSFPFGLGLWDAAGNADHTVTDHAYNLVLK